MAMCDYFDNNICILHTQVEQGSTQLSAIILATDAVTENVDFFLNFIAYLPSILLPNIRFVTKET